MNQPIFPPSRPQILDWVRRMFGEAGVNTDAMLSGGLSLGNTAQPPIAGCLHLEKSIYKSTAIGVQVTRSTDQSLPNNTDTLVSFDTLRFDPEGMFDAASPAQLTCQVSGIYLLVAQTCFASSSSGRRITRILLNTNTVLAYELQAAYASGSTYMSAVTLHAVDEGDVLQCQVNQNSGSSLALRALAEYSPLFSAIRVA